MQKKHLTLFFPNQYRTQMAVLMLLADLLGFGITLEVMHLLNGAFNWYLFDSRWIEYLVVFLISMSLFLASRLYPGVGVYPADEMKLVTQYLGIGCISGIMLLIIFRQAALQHYFVMISGGGLALFFILFSRWGIRIIAVQQGWWGEPVAIMGQSENISRTAWHFLRRNRLGFLPVLAITTSPPEAELPIPMISLSEAFQSDVDRFYQANIRTLLVDSFSTLNTLDTASGRSLFNAFERVIFVSNMDWLDGASVFVHQFEGLIGIEAQKNYLRVVDALFKRILDIFLAIVIGLIFLPIILLSILLIKLDSPGGVFYTQERIGKGGRRILIYKLRSMVLDAEQILQNYLEENAAAREEWEQTQKIKDDPRITRVGYYLRKFSIDELPQIFNVLKGDMSMVGPRPIMFGQEGLYGEKFDTYCSVRPGITGLWQVSGRNRTTFDERARFDQYYVRNWSIWLDFYILLRTIWVVFTSDGAY